MAHREFLDWLANNAHPAWSSGLREEGHRRIIVSAEQSPLPSAVTALTPTDLYQLLQLPSHWLAQGNADAAWRWLTNLDEVRLLDDVTQSFHDRWYWTREVSVWDCRVEQLNQLVSGLPTDAFAELDGIRKTNYLAAAYMNRGVARRGQQDFAAAVQDYDRAIDLRKKLLAACGGEQAAVSTQRALVNDLAAAYMNRGVARQGQQDFAAAVQDYDRAIDLLEKLLAACGGEQAAVSAQRALVNYLAAAYMNRGVARRGQQDFAAAVQDYDRAIELRKKLLAACGGEQAAVSTQPALVNDLAAAYVNRGVARQGQQDFAAAVQDYDRAIDLLEKLLADCGGEQAAVSAQRALVNDLAGAYMNRGVAREGQQDFVAAVQDYDRAIDLLEKLLAACGGEQAAVSAQPALVNDLAAAYMNRGVARDSQQDFAAAVQDYDRAIELLEKLLAVGWQFVLGDYLLALRNRMLSHDAQEDVAAVMADVLLAMASLVRVYREVGQQIRLPSVARQFAMLDRWVVTLQVEANLDDELRAAWAELRELFAAE
ncbi:MAG: tetratricopeptide repeat protein [Planctomycetota bacterium]|nr:tetratricopeptide repeat protein [Planctomycetota bacterium]